MEFCPKCGSRLEPKKSKTGKTALLMLVCPKCGYKKQESAKKVEPVVKVIQHNPLSIIQGNSGNMQVNFFPLMSS